MLLLVLSLLAAEPATLSPSLPLDAGVVGATLVLHGWALEYDRLHPGGECPCGPGDVPPWDRWALGRNDHTGGEASTALEYAFVFGAPSAALLTDPGTPGDRAVAAGITIEALVATSAVTNFLKSTVHRPRPYAIDGQPQPTAVYHSFPSGHTSASFAGASALFDIWRLRHPQSRATPWIGAGLYAAAAACGFLRVEAGRHYPSDVVAGAGIGTAVGWGIVEAHRQHRVLVGVARDRLTAAVVF